ncbi:MULTISPECIES: acyltransferase [unclassified Bradyrhizobium]|uniref:acyltransferase family protein n=1 Tax=unclassified Bradyrhizobium TaxID=2631580 RepID=UPI0028EF0A01|nr:MULTISPECIES: acyltransferase [unclassified Bradyrhizobium]
MLGFAPSVIVSDALQFEGATNTRAYEFGKRCLASKEIYTIQYLRAVAALFVLYYHLALRYGGPIPIGTFPLDLFFVISGFITWVISVDRPIGPSAFMLRRIVRLVPNYWLATFATAVLILVKPNFTYGHELDLSRFVGSLFFWPTLSGDRILPIVLQGWTLIYEMMFYILVAVSLLVAQRYRPLFLAAAVGTLAVLHEWIPDAHFVSLTSPNILLEFLAGVLLGVVWKNVSLSIGWALLFLAAGPIGLALSEYYRPDGLSLLALVVPPVLVVAGAAYYEKSRGLPDIRLLRFLGDASYSIFIWHVFVSIILEGLLLHLKLPVNLHFALVVLATVGLTCLIYLWVERPMTDYVRGLVARKPLRPLPVQRQAC